MSSFTVSRVSLLGLIYALLTLAAPAEEHWTTSTVSSVPSSFSTFSASTPTSSPSASGSSIGSASSSTSSSTGPAPPGFHSHTTVVRSLTSTTEVPSFVTSETSFTLDFTQATPFAFTKPTIPSTLVTATRAPTGYTVKAPVYNEVCKMGLKFCEIDTVIDCDVKGECQVCATSEAGIRNCRWFKGNEFANYDKQGCNDPNYWCADFWHAGYNLQHELQCSLMDWAEWLSLSTLEHTGEFKEYEPHILNKFEP
ncbi:MAG: hypothetical protein L6R40_008521 [Gallowayella cf. fulva]|nr:MAG: hypothetical protein L6R40_008521 [Xanthomendoza cf. fulva]